MSSSPPITPLRSEFPADLTALMFAVSPVRAGVRRPRPDTDDENGDDFLSSPRPPNTTGATSVNANDLNAVRRYATRKRLKTEMMPDIDEFYSGPIAPQLSEGFIFVNQLLTLQKIDEFTTLAPGWEISKDLQVNISSVCYGAALSPSARLYKGDALIATVLKIILDRGFDIPKNIDSNAAMKRKLTTAIKNSLTEARSQIKKDIAKSVCIKATKSEKTQKPTMTNATKHQSLIVLAETIGRHCDDGFLVTPEFCARVALMRRVYMKNNSDNFWSILGDELDVIHRAASTTVDPVTGKLPTAPEAAKRVSKAFRGILDHDRKSHGDPSDKANDAINTMPTQADAHQIMINDALQLTTASGADTASGDE
ncbi:hypothetical protein GGX14DRAFT_406586 [Mycena pura]|uniref:Uncharacterized protein n=1 Tax=Mycena pura TaxID=153505 RepID=A0AAD6UTT9_9AGAR|nr:hypothetical protein GGX14DRAFT_406586 [Mycena pura]